MRFVLFGMGLAGWLLLGPQQTKAETLELQPTSDWKLREYDDKCRVSRTFGEGEDRVTLWLFKGGPSRFINITAIGRPFRNPYGARVTVGFSPREPLSRGYISSTSSKGRPVISLFGVSVVSYQSAETADAVSKDAEKEERVDLSSARLGEQATVDEIATRYAAIQSLNLSGALVQKVSLKTGPLTDVLSLFAECIEGMPKRRAASSEIGNGKSQSAKTIGEREWAMQISADYPAHLLREMKQGGVGVRVQVSPKGRATFCEVTSHYGPAGFNDSACLAMMRHSRFEPALDANGEPIWGSYSTRITYRIN